MDEKQAYKHFEERRIVFMKMKKVLSALIGLALSCGSIGSITASANWSGTGYGDGSSFSLSYETSSNSTYYYLTSYMYRKSGTALYAMNSNLKLKNGSYHSAATPNGVVTNTLSNPYIKSQVTTSSVKGDVYYYSKVTWSDCTLVKYVTVIG